MNRHQAPQQLFLNTQWAQQSQIDFWSYKQYVPKTY